MQQVDILGKVAEAQKSIAEALNNVIGSSADSKAVQSTFDKVQSTFDRKSRRIVQSEERRRILTKQFKSRLVEKIGKPAGNYVSAVIEEMIGQIIQESVVKDNKKKFIFPLNIQKAIQGDSSVKEILIQPKKSSTSCNHILVIRQDGNAQSYDFNPNQTQYKLEADF